MTHLVDGNVLIALATPDHIHHDAAHQWRETADPGVATCPMTQGTLLRQLLRQGATAHQAWQVLESFCSQPDHEFWADTLPYADVGVAGIMGHRQVTDAYLAQLARSHSARLVTFDGGLAALHPDVTILVSIN